MQAHREPPSSKGDRSADPYSARWCLPKGNVGAGLRAIVIPTYEEKTVSEMSLDEIMSGRGETVSEPKTAAPEPTAEQTAEAERAARDEKGRFAPKVEPTPEAPAPAVAEAAQPAPEGQEQQPNGFVPIKALDAERGKRKELEDTLRELQQQVTRLTQTQQPAQPAEPAKPAATLWDDPDAYLQSRLTPVEQQLMEQREFLSENLAVQAHGADKVEAAKKAIEQVAATPEGRLTIEKMMQSRHPFEELVKWHQEHSFRTEIGSDPEAYKQKIIADYLASQQQTTTQAQQQPHPAPAPVMPSPFAKSPTSGPRGPEVAAGPRALSDIMKR